MRSLPRRRIVGRALVIALAVVGCGRRDAPPAVRAAVAANFAGAFERIARLYEERSGRSVEGILGSSGSLATQIEQGAPFDVFLSADEERPRRLVERGLAVADSRFSYVRGRLALVGPAVAAETPLAELLTAPGVRRIALADPDLAPYGRAAMETLETLGVAERVRDRLVFGTNVAQTWHFATSGAAELGFVALSQALAKGTDHRVVPDRFHRPVLQDAVLLARARDRQAASGFLEFLRTDPEVAKTVLALGYAPANGR